MDFEKSITTYQNRPYSTKLRTYLCAFFIVVEFGTVSLLEDNRDLGCPAGLVGGIPGNPGIRESLEAPGSHSGKHGQESCT